MTPPVADGGLSDSGVTHSANAVPTVLVGGVAGVVAFAGHAPRFPGVNQINIVGPLNTPTGDAVADSGL